MGLFLLIQMPINSHAHASCEIMTKLVFSILSLFSTITACYPIVSDTTRSEFNLEVGYSSSMFLEYPRKNNLNEDIPSYLRLNYLNKNKWGLGASIHRHYELNTNKKVELPLYVNMRYYYLDNLYISKRYKIGQFKSFYIEPTFLITCRFSGMENLWVIENQNSSFEKYYSGGASLKSFGIGLGFNVRKQIFKRFTINLSSQYSRQFEKYTYNSIKGKTYDEAMGKYKINKNLLLGSIGLCYSFIRTR